MLWARTENIMRICLLPSLITAKLISEFSPPTRVMISEMNIKVGEGDWFAASQTQVWLPQPTVDHLPRSMDAQWPAAPRREGSLGTFLRVASQVWVPNLQFFSSVGTVNQLSWTLVMLPEHQPAWEPWQHQGKKLPFTAKKTCINLLMCFNRSLHIFSAAIHYLMQFRRKLPY